MTNKNKTEEAFKDIFLTREEKIRCLKGIIKKHYRILHVYEKSLNQDNEYDYKMFVRSFALYVSTSNTLFGGNLVDILINLCSIIEEDLSHSEIRKIVFDNLNYANFLLKRLEEEGEKCGDN